MMQTTIEQDEIGYSGLSMDLFLDELVAALANLVPEVRVTARPRGVRFGRGTATAEVASGTPTRANVTFKHGFDTVLTAGVPLTAAGLNDLAADLVGFFCGASLVTLALCPQAEPVRAPRTRPRRRGPYDAPLIPLPFDPPMKARG